MALASKFKYKPRTQEQVEKRLNRTGGSFQGFLHDDYKTFKPAVGDNFIRFLPPTWDNAEHWGYEVHVHYGVGPDRASVLCLSKMFNKKCPICEAQAAARKANDEELAKELAPRLQVVSWVVNMKETSLGPLLWSVGFRMDSDIIKLTRDRESGELLQIDNPEEGYNVSFQREGTTVTNTRYSGWQTSKRPSAIEEKWLAYAIEHPVPETFVHRTYDEVKALFEGADKGEDTKQTDEEEKPKFVSKLRATPPKSDPEPEPESSGEAENAEPEAEEAEKPRTPTEAAGMSAADKLRAKLAARKAAVK